MYEENLLEEDSHQRGFHRAGGGGGEGGGVSRCAGRGGGLCPQARTVCIVSVKNYLKKKRLY